MIQKNTMKATLIGRENRHGLVAPNPTTSDYKQWHHQIAVHFMSPTVRSPTIWWTDNRTGDALFCSITVWVFFGYTRTYIILFTLLILLKISLKSFRYKRFVRLMFPTLTFSRVTRIQYINAYTARNYTKQIVSYHHLQLAYVLPRL